MNNALIQIKIFYNLYRIYSSSNSGILKNWMSARFSFAIYSFYSLDWEDDTGMTKEELSSIKLNHRCVVLFS